MHMIERKDPSLHKRALKSHIYYKTFYETWKTIKHDFPLHGLTDESIIVECIKQKRTAAVKSFLIIPEYITNMVIKTLVKTNSIEICKSIRKLLIRNPVSSYNVMWLAALHGREKIYKIFSYRKGDPVENVAIIPNIISTFLQIKKMRYCRALDFIMDQEKFNADIVEYLNDKIIEVYSDLILQN